MNFSGTFYSPGVHLSALNTVSSFQDAPTTPFLRHFELNLPDAVGEFLQTSTKWQSERLHWPALGTMMVQHRPVEEAEPALGGAQMVTEEETMGKLYSTPVARKDEHPASYNIRQQIGESAAAKWWT